MTTPETTYTELDQANIADGHYQSRALRAQQQACPHANTRTDTRGGWHFTDEGPVDDIRTVIMCLDCGAEYDPPEALDMQIEPLDMPF